MPAGTWVPTGLCGISAPFGTLSPTQGQIAYVLLTRAPLYSPLRAFAFDLHVLSTPPAFVLSQDQTLQFDILNRHLTVSYLYSAKLYKSFSLNYKDNP